MIDASTKQWAKQQQLFDRPIQIIQNQLYLFLGTNDGGSFGLSDQFVWVCLTLPATLVFIMALWTRRRLKEGLPISALQQLGFGLLIGGTLGNWSERVIQHGVTDFIYVKCLGDCIFNMADFSIDIGFFILLVEAIKVTIKKKAPNSQLEVSK